MMEANNNKGYIAEMKAAWPQLNMFERFEYAIAAAIMLIISLVVVVALIRLGKNVFVLLVLNAGDPLDFSVFQRIFGNILTLLIAMEFMRSIEGVLQGKGHIIQIKIVILIALIAVVRKFIVMDKAVSAENIAALAFVTLALGAVYWVLRESKR